jgi:hypothetical protein
MTLRELPSVDEVLQAIDGSYPHTLAVAETRRVIEEARTILLGGSRGAQGVAGEGTRAADER